MTDASDQIVNSKSELAAMVRTLTMQRDQARAEVERLRDNPSENQSIIASLRSENERLKDESGGFIEPLQAEIERLAGLEDYQRKEANRLREALGFYAEYNNYRESYISGERMRSVVEIDSGEKARTVLNSSLQSTE